MNDHLKTIAVGVVLLAVAACSKSTGPQMSRTPVSVRGWIEQVEPPDTEFFRLREKTTGAVQQQRELFQQTTVAVEGTQFASGGIAENGSFIILDVPPGDVTLAFSAPGIPNAALKMQGVPPNADVLIPSLRLTRNGAAEILDPQSIAVRVPITKDDPSPAASVVTIGGHSVTTRAVPLSNLMDRRDYPEPRRRQQ